MRIEIVRVQDGGRVVFRCALGRAEGLWVGPPSAGPGQLFDVELDVEEPILGWTDAASPGTIAEGPAGEVVLTGTVLAAGDAADPVVELALGGDIVMLERPAGGWDASPGDVVALHVAVVRLYPYQL